MIRMKSETIKKIAVIESIFIFILFGIIIFCGIIQGRKNRDYKTEIDRLEKSIIEYGETNTELDRIKTELENDKQGLDKIINRNGKEIQRLEYIINKLQTDTSNAINTIDEIEKLFTEILGD